MKRRNPRKSRPPRPTPARAAAIAALLGLINAEYKDAVMVDLVVWDRSDGSGASVLSLRPSWTRPVVDEEPDAVYG